MAKLKFDRTALQNLVSKLGPTDDITLVHDQGIYLMSFKEKMVDGQTKRTVVYARGLDPKDGEEVWDKARAAVGGDDFAEKVTTAKDMLDVLEKSEGDIIIGVTESAFSVSYLPKRTPEQTAARIAALEAWVAKVYAPGAPAKAMWSPKMKRSVMKCEKELASLKGVR
jgi:hypothetical protein